jgi:NTP pyrophosphatase (non-canonical NTP hydrolase)
MDIERKRKIESLLNMIETANGFESSSITMEISKLLSECIPANKLTSAASERLGWLLEEAGEVQQIIGKIIRHGYESTWPPGQSPTNRELLESELRDLMFVVQLMHKNKDLDLDKIMNMLKDKDYKKCYLHHQNL